MIDFYFTLTEPEYFEAQKLFMGLQYRKFRWWRWAVPTLLILGSMATLANSPRPLSFGTIPTPVFSLLAAAIAFFFFPQLQKLGIRKRFLKEKSRLANIHLTLDETGYHTQAAGIGSGVAEWTGMDGWMEGKLVIVLPCGTIMRLIPKSSLEDSQVNELRDLLSQKLGPEGVIRKR